MSPFTYVVSSTGDQPAVNPSVGPATAVGSITLRSAIQAANAHPNDPAGIDRIEFNIAGSGVQRIMPASELPTITDQVVIDGYSQPESKANTLEIGDNAAPLIQLDNPFGFTTGLKISAGASTVRGLIISRFIHATHLTDHGGNTIAGNFLGLDASGNLAGSNTEGVFITKGADGNTIGGTDPADRNMIGGNVVGVKVVASSNNVIQGNYFGLKPSGIVPGIGNGQAAIIVTSGGPSDVIGPATGNLIGGTVAGARNVMSRNGAGVIFGGDQAELTTGNMVQGNYIGTNVNGTSDQANFNNNGPGVLFDSGKGDHPGVRANTVGGVTQAARNVISGNTTGVLVATDATDNVIQGNYIGTDPTGSKAVPNGTGIQVSGSYTTIVGNLVSGSSNGAGIYFYGGDIALVQSNLIGTDATGTRDISNVYGIEMAHSNHVTIGGTTAAERNVVSGNAFSAIYIYEFGKGHVIRGNYIGPDITGTKRIGNGGDGILIDFYDASGTNGQTLIGGTDPEDGNVIAYNLANGIEIRNSTAIAKEADGEIGSNKIFSNARNGILLTHGNVADPHYRITRNSIYSNSFLGIDLGDDGVTPNDSKGHVGPNDYQNVPIITSAMTVDAATVVSGTLKGRPNRGARIEFFANAESDPSGHGEGQTFLGFVSLGTDADGNASFDDIVLPALPEGQTLISATAADGDGSTSEFSGTVQVNAAPAADLSIAMTAAPDPVQLGADLTYTITVTNNSTNAADNVALTTAVPLHATFLSFAKPDGWTSTVPPVGLSGTVSANVAHLDGGAKAVFTFVVRVDGNAPSGYFLGADGSVTSDTEDPNPANNMATAAASTPPIDNIVDLAITVSAAPKSVHQGEAVIYTVTITNNGTIVAGNNAVTVDVPTNSTYQSVDAPVGWSTFVHEDGGKIQLLASFNSLEVGQSAAFTMTVLVDQAATIGGAVTAKAHVASESGESNPGDNFAEDSATVAPIPTASVAVGIAGNINPATVGQDVTYTITVSNTSGLDASGVVVHVAVPAGVAIVSAGVGVPTASGLDFSVGTLGAGAARPFLIKAHGGSVGTITITASLAAEAGVAIGDPASVTTNIVAPPVVDPPVVRPTPPTVVRAVRYGFHDQATVLVVTFSKDVNAAQAADPRNYSVFASAKGDAPVTRISRVFYNPQTHQATLRTAQKIYVFHPWRLVVRKNITDLAGTVLQSNNGASGDFVTEMDRRSLAGPASNAPGALRVGIKPVPIGPLARKQGKPMSTKAKAHSARA